jgi:hypothetical protein
LFTIDRLKLPFKAYGYSTPRRWVVERTFSWLSNYRHLSKHYEYWNEADEAMIDLAMIHLMLRRLTKTKQNGIA